MQIHIIGRWKSTALREYIHTRTLQFKNYFMFSIHAVANSYGPHLSLSYIQVTNLIWANYYQHFCQSLLMFVYECKKIILCVCRCVNEEPIRRDADDYLLFFLQFLLMI